jgi:hypothetical protein
MTNISIGNDVTNIGEEAFGFCTSLISITIPNNVTSIEDNTFLDCTCLTSIAIGIGVSSLGSYAFQDCNSLKSVYFKGNAPNVYLNALTMPVYFYYMPGTVGWGSTFSGRPAVLWNPHAQKDASFGVRTNRFGFNITGSSNLVIVVEACTNFANPVWLLVSTNMLNTFVGTNGTSYFSDPQWTNYPGRFYRLRSP